jgi:hypothetical protein
MGRSVFVLALSMVISLIALPIRAADNPLIGSWKWDNNKTLREFRLPRVGSEQFKSDAARAKRFVEGQIRNLQSNMTLTYTDQQCTQVIVGNSGTVISRESIPYKILELGKDYVVVDQMKNGGVGKVFLAGNSFYVEVNVGEFTYRDYFTKI